MIRFPKVLLLFSMLLYHSADYGILNAQESRQQPNFYFEEFALPGGDTGNDVLAIAQDSFGFMWFGSKFGLHRWDGYAFKSYWNNLEDSTSIASNYIESMYVAKDGTLWLGHSGKGLDRYDYQTDQFYHYTLNPEDINSYGSIIISEMEEDHDGNLWIATSKGLFRMDTNTEEVQKFQHDPNDPNSLSFNVCRTLLVDSEGILWIGTGFPWGRNPKGGLNRYRPETEDFVHYFHDPKDPNSLANDKVSEIFEDSKGNLWIGSVGDGLHLFDRKTEKFQRLQQQANTSNRLHGPFVNDDPSRHIRFIREDQNQKIWIGALEGGIKYYDPETGFIKDYYHDENDPQSLPEQTPWTMFQSQDGTFWIATNGPIGKVYKFHETSFEYFPINNSEHTIYSFSKSADETIWVGTDQSKLLQFNSDTKVIQPFGLEPVKDKNSNPEAYHTENMFNYFLKTIIDEEGSLWGRKFLPRGLYRLNPTNSVLTLFQYQADQENSIGDGGVTDILKTKQGRIWAVTSKGDLNLYSSEAEGFKKYNLGLEASEEEEFFSLLAQGTEDKIWIAGSGGSERQAPFLKRFNPGTGQFDIINDDIISSDLVFTYETIQGLLEDNFGNVWICSNTKLLKINPKTGAGKSYLASDLGALFFKGFTIDDQGLLWLIGDKITLFDPSSETSSNFVMKFNLQPTANYTQYVFKDSAELIYFGGKGGFQVIDTRKIKNDGTVPPLTLIKDFKFLNEFAEERKESSLPITILGTEKIHLKYNQNAFTFDFAALSFQHPESNRHEFKLEGYDQEWRSVGAEPAATYVKIPPGNYTFRVRGATLRSEWGPEKSVKIRISPPWWASTTAYIVYGFLILLTLYLLRYFELKKQRLKLEGERKLNQQLRRLDQLKDQFLANTSHELKTPLQGIIGLSESWLGKANNEELREDLAMITSSGKRLSNLVNDILDFSKLKNFDIELLRRPINLKVLVEIVLHNNTPLIKGKNLELINAIPKALPAAYGDENRLQQVLYNLIGNAIKFTEKGFIKIDAIEKEGILQVCVEDTGIGIPEGKKEAIFQEFEQGDGSISREFSGTGLGLSISKRLVELHGGKMWVKSPSRVITGQSDEKNIGSSFFFTLPVSKEKATTLVPSFSQTKSLSTEEINPAIAFEPATYLSQEIGDVKLLIVDDEPINQQVLKKHLSDQNFQLIQALNGVDALKAIKNDPDIDLVLLDVMMPQMSGYEVCRQIRKKYLPSELPVIMITAKNQLQDIVQGLSIGANDYVPKPFQREELLARIKTQLDLHSIFKVADRFVPNEFLQSLNHERITDVALGDYTKQEVTVLFTDIRDYTSLAEMMTPEENFKFVSSVHGQMGPIIRKNKGFINQYLGDAIMAIFPKDPEDALIAAIDMQKQLVQYNLERTDQGLVPIRMGIGLHTGPLIMGIIGDQKRLDAATIADSVNTASRIESLNKYFGTSILLSDECLHPIKNKENLHLRYLGQVIVKGKKEPVGIYECFEGDNQDQFNLKLNSTVDFEQGLAYFFAKKFPQAIESFSRLNEANPADRVVQLFLKKSANFIQKGVPDDWTGIETMTFK